MIGYDTHGRQYPEEWDEKTLPECPVCGADEMQEERVHPFLPGMKLVCAICGYTEEEDNDTFDY